MEEARAAEGRRHSFLQHKRSGAKKRTKSLAVVREYGELKRKGTTISEADPSSIAVGFNQR